MTITEQEFLQFLEHHHFIYQYSKHPAVFTCEEAEKYYPDVPAVSTKNLFLCDKKARQFFLAVTSCEKSVHFESLAAQFGITHARFSSEESLIKLLGVTRGSVTMMGLVNDTEHKVDLWIDKEIWNSENFLCHPLVNTATLVLTKSELERFFALTGHMPKFF